MRLSTAIFRHVDHLAQRTQVKKGKPSALLFGGEHHHFNKAAVTGTPEANSYCGARASASDKEVIDLQTT
jgi:hypothetical protein